MDSKNKVIDMTARRQAQLNNNEPALVNSSTPVVDMTERRNEILNQERRQVRRTILTEFIGAFAVIPNLGLVKVALYDISENGVAFDLDPEYGQFREGEEIAMRVYLNQQTYFPFVAKIKNVRVVPDEGVIRCGTHYVKGTVNDLALHHFTKFIETVSASLKRDAGDVMVSNLNK